MTPIQIKRPAVVANARALAELTETSITEAVGNAVRDQLAIARVRADARLSKRRKRAERALVELRSLPVVGSDISDRDLYDAEGLPK